MVNKQTEPDDEMILFNLSWSTKEELLQGTIITIIFFFLLILAMQVLKRWTKYDSRAIMACI